VNSINIEHIAIWVKDLDVSADFYAKFFGANIGTLYHNPKTNFSSRFITFEFGTRVEIMTRPDITEMRQIMPLVTHI
jgi:lactoylglutathione lyase